MQISDSPAVASWKAHQPEPTVQFDPNFQMDSEWYEHSAEFLVAIDLADGIAGEQRIEAAVALRSVRRPALPAAKAQIGGGGSDGCSRRNGAGRGRPRKLPADEAFSRRRPPPRNRPQAPSRWRASARSRGLFGFCAGGAELRPAGRTDPMRFPLIPNVHGLVPQRGRIAVRRGGCAGPDCFALAWSVFFTALGAAVSAGCRGLSA